MSIRETETETEAPAAPLRRTAPSPGRARWVRRLRGDRAPLSWEWRTLVLFALLALWQLASATDILRSEVLAAPSDVAARFVALVLSGDLQNALLTSLSRAALGFLLGTAIAVAAAVLVALTRVGDAVIDPPLQILRTLPLLGLVPLFIIWFGVGEWPKILLVALGVSIPLYVNLVLGIRSIDPDLYELADALDFSARARFAHIIIPGAAPGALVGLRQALGFSWLALIVAEQIAADAGLGFLINNARDFLQTDTIIVGLLTYAMLGLVTDGIVRLVEQRTTRWRGTREVTHG